MIQTSHLSTTPNNQLKITDEDTYMYKETIVKVITIFNDYNGSIALVENEGGELFEVPQNALISN